MKIFYLPDLGEGLAEAEVREWYVTEGDEVQVDQPLASMETAKAVVDVPSPYAGKIVKLHGKINEAIKTGSPFITFDTGEGSAEKGSVVGALEESEEKWNEEDVVTATHSVKSVSIKAMPAARILAKELHVDLATVKATGPQGLITPDDVKRHLQTKTSSHPLTGETEVLHGVRRTMAHAMMQSHQEIVPVTIVDDADLTHLPKEVDLTVLLLKAIAAASKLEPTLNAWFDGKTLERKLFDEVHIGLASDTKEGLFVPVIKNVEKSTDQDLRNTIDRFKKSVKDRTITPQEMHGATITLSNFGMIAGRYATPIIVQPMVAILACGKSREAALVRESKLIVGRILPLSLTFDHRAVTGGEAARFLGAVMKQIEKS